MKIFNRFFVSILTCFLFVASIGAEEPLIEEVQEPLVYNTEEEAGENPENVVEGTTEGVAEGEDETVIDSNEPTSEGIASTENEVETLQEENSSVESLPELATFEKEIVYNEDHTIATVILTYTGECTELNIANADEVQEFVNIGVYRANVEKGDWETKIAFDILLNGMIYFEINVWNNDKLIGTVPVRCSITGLNNDQLIFDPNQEPITYEITSSDVGSTDSRNMTLSYETNVSFTWSIPTELSMADIEDDLTITVNNSNLATETALRIRVASNNNYNLVNSESGETLSYIITDQSSNLIKNDDVILDHLYNQNSTSNTLNIKLTKMPVYSGGYSDTLTFTASVERMLSSLYSGQTIVVSNLGTTHNLNNTKIYGVSKQDGTPTPDNPVEIQSVVNPTVTVSGKNLLNPKLQTITKDGVTCTNNGDGTYTLNGVSTGTIYFNITTLTLKGTYKLIGTPSNRGESSLFEAIEYRPDLGDGVILQENGDRQILITIVAYEGTYNNVVYKPMITTDLNATYDDFEPYAEEPQSANLQYTLNAIPVSEGGNITVNGQHYIADYVDIENKKLVRMTKLVDMYSLNWSMVTNDNVNYFYSLQNDMSFDGFGICTDYLYNKISHKKLSDKQIVCGNKEFSGSPQIVVRDDDYNSAEDFKNSLSGANLLYELETPTITDLTDAEVQAFKDLYTYSPTTVVSASSDQLTPYIEFGLS